MTARSRLPFAVGVALLALGCSDGTGPGATPKTVEIVSGHGQGALPGEMAPEPLRVRVTGSDGKPLAGITVRWTVIEGQATVTPQQSSTDSRGEAETRVTLDASSGVEVQATVQGLSPVTFSIGALDPCLPSSAPPLSLQVPVNGALRQGDCDLGGDGRLWDFHHFTLGAQQGVTLRLRAPTFDPYASIFARATNGVYYERGGTFDTDDATRLAVSTWILPAGAYEATASSFDLGVTGAYELLVSPAPGEADGCRPVWVLRGVTTEQRLTTTDCADTPGPFQRDLFYMVLWFGERVTLTQSSTAFAPRLRLLRPSGTLISESDGSATGTALVSFTSDETSLYIVHATSAVAGRTGAYTLAVIAPDPGASASSSGAPIGSQRQASPSPQGTSGVRTEQ